MSSEIVMLVQLMFGSLHAPPSPSRRVNDRRALSQSLKLTILHQVTGVDIFFGRGRDPNDEDEDDENGGNNGVQEYIKKRWNLNARFREDRSDDRLRPETFDLVNSRLLAEGIDADRWPLYIRELKHLLKPGGWLQMVELQLHFQSDAGLLSDDSCLTRWWQWYSNTMQQMRKNPRIGRDLQRLLTAEGFNNITARSLDLPIGSWRSGKVMSISVRVTPNDS